VKDLRNSPQSTPPPEPRAWTSEKADAPSAQFAQRYSARDAPDDILSLGDLLGRATPAGIESGDVAASPKNLPEHTKLLRLTKDRCSPFSAPDGRAYADIRNRGHRETLPIRGPAFKNWLISQYYEAFEEAPSAEARERVIGTYEAMANRCDEVRPVHLRVAAHDGKLYLDLCDASWRAVEIDADGWRLVDAPPVRFRRSPSMEALPTPEHGGSIEALRKFLNTSSEEDWVLAIAWLLASLRPSGPYPVLVLSGEQGTAKSTASRILRSLTDPNGAATRCVPRGEQDLAIAADNSHVLAFDNVSKLVGWASDALCRLATGGAYTTRSLYTARDEEVFSAARPMILNGIPDFVTRGDLASRSIHMYLEPIDQDQRRPESELWREFDAARPAILGALLDIASAGLRALPTLKKPDRLPRMADFALWILACEEGLWEPGTFAAAFAGNSDEAVATALDGDPYAALVRKLALRPEGWAGTATEFAEAAVRELVLLDKGHSPAAKVVGERLRRAAPLLRQEGIAIEFDRQGRAGHRVIRIAGPAQSVEAELSAALQALDWHYSYSDDSACYSAGDSAWRRIVELCARVDPTTARDLFAQWCPGDSPCACPV
jgi:hypothetical protein